MSAWGWLKINDPGLINLRKAGRTLLLAPTIFVISDQLFDQPLVGAFGFFACFVYLVFADFGGAMGARAMAYVAATVLATVAVIVGSLLSGTTVGVAAAMFAIMFAVSFAAIYGGYAPAFVSPVALAYSFSIFLPLSEMGVGDRVLGWIIGGAVAMIGALLLWPVDRRADLRQLLAAVAAALAEALSSREDRDKVARCLRQALDSLSDARAKTATPLQPAGVTSHDVGLLHLVEDLGYAADLTDEVIAAPAPGDDQDLLVQVIGSLRRNEAVLLGRDSPASLAVEIDALDNARQARRRQVVINAVQAYRRRTSSASGSVEEADPLKELSQSSPLLALSHVTLWIEADAAEATGTEAQIHPVKSASELSGEKNTPPTAIGRARNIAAAELDPDGVILRNSIRAAVAMTLGVVLAKSMPIDHQFWITLGVLLVLRSNAASTSATALRAVAGTFAGFLAAAAVLLAFGDSETVLWLLMPVAVFFAAYAPGAVGFTTGQVSFTVMVVILFTIIHPEGIATDIARLETVTMGAVSAAFVALILWPRGARGALARAAAAVYRAAAEGLRVGVSGSAADRHAADQRLKSAHLRANSAFVVAIGEHGERIEATAWVALSHAPAVVRSLLEGLLPPLPASPAEGCKGAVGSVLRQASATSDRLAGVAERLERSRGRPQEPAAAGAPDDLAADLRYCLMACAAVGEERVDQAFIIVAWSTWLDRLGRDIADAAPALDAVAAASGPDAWLGWSARRAARSTGVGEAGTG